MNKFLVILAGLALCILVLFLLPVPQKQVEQLHTGNPKLIAPLLEFRNQPVKSISIEGSSWKYICLGSGEESLLFLHGMGGAYDIWWQQINSLKKQFKVISLTLPAVNSLEQTVKGINAILKAEQINKISIIGTSMGGYIAQNYLEQHPEKVNKLVLGNTFPPNQEFKDQNSGIRKMLPYVPEWLIMSMFRKNLDKNVVAYSESDPIVKAYLLEQYYGLMDKKQFIGRLDIVLDELKITYDSTRKSIPKLIIEADNDPLIPSELRERLKDNFPEAQVYTFHNKGHFEYINAAEEYSKVLSDFLIEKSVKQIHKTIENYFIGRIRADLPLLKEAFHPKARLVNAVATGKNVVLSLDEYLDIVKLQGPQVCQTELISLDVNGHIATAQTVFDYGEQIYLDLLILVKNEENWQIINKTFEKYKPNEFPTKLLE